MANVLLIHSSKLNYEVKEKTKLAEEITKDLEKKNIKDCLIAFCAFGEEDDGKSLAVAKQLAEEIKDVAGKVNEKTIVLYPYVHLLFGKKPSKSDTALKAMDEAKQALEKEGFVVHRAPFGYYKAFELSCKGHPLSELSRVIEAGKTGKAEESKAVGAERKLSSKWFILDTNGELHALSLSKDKSNVEGFDFGNTGNLEAFCLYEMAKSREVKEEPPHVRLMKQLGIAGYEPGSDQGNLRYPPNGKMMKALVEELVTREMHDYGAMEIESPVMYDFGHPALKSYLERFPARQYIVETPNKKAFLRFAACFGQFLLMHDAVISYKHLPLKVYELAKYSFRAEQSGELTGLRRLRAFTMPDCHAFVADLEMAKKEMIERFNISKKIQELNGFRVPEELEFAIRVVKPFWEKNRDFVVGLVKSYGRPTLLEMWDEQFFYFVLKYEWNFVDNLGKASALNTDQIDVENAERYDINFIDKEGKKTKPLILHCSPSGASERVLYGLLEKAAREEKQGKIPSLPLWLTPTQARLIPISVERHLDYCKKLLSELKKEKIRVDIDDNVETVSKRIRQAEHEWAHAIIVVGDKELEGRELNVRWHETGKQEKTSLKQFIEKIKNQTNQLPFRPLPMNELLSKRPIIN